LILTLLDSHRRRERHHGEYAGLNAVTPGAPFIWDVLLVAVKDQVVERAVKTTRKEQRIALPDGYTKTVEVAAGDLRVELRSNDEVVVTFSSGSCSESSRSHVHVFNCSNERPTSMVISNPTFMGFGSGTATLDLTTTVTVSE
jgi:hypothetical protein